MRVRSFPLCLFLMCCVLESGGLLMQKLASDTAAPDASGFPLSGFLLSLAGNPWLWLAILCALAQLFLWPRVLSRSEISLVYPLTSINYILGAVGSVMFFSEQLTIYVLLGTALIVAGVALVGTTAKAKRALDGKLAS